MINLKRFLCVLVALCMFLSIAPTSIRVQAAEIASGTCGTSGGNVTWVLTDDGHLTFSGTGDMVDWQSGFTGWYDFRERITSVTIEDGVTNIGAYVFWDWYNMTSVTIPDSVTIIGDSAFFGCGSLTSIIIPDGVASIGAYAFSNCYQLTSITIPNSVISIESAAFNCTNLNAVYYGGSQEEWNKIRIDDMKSEWLLDAPIHYNSTGNTKPTPDTNIPQDALFWNSHAYAVFDNCDTWEEAAAYCASIGGHLATITSVEENTALFAYLKQLGRPNAYFGLSDSTNEGHWTWITGEANSYLNWHAGEPNSEHPNENYAMFYYQFDDGTWNDGDFGGQTLYGGTAFICEWENAQEGIPVPPSSEQTKPDDTQTGLFVFSDHTDPRVRIGGTITFRAGITVDGKVTEDSANLVAQIEDPSILELFYTNVYDNCRYVILRGLKEGQTYVSFNDPSTGNSVKVQVSVYESRYCSYTLNSVPLQYIEKYPTNFYNVNGLFIDSYTYTVNDDQTATVTFDVYNTNYTYGIVEVLDEGGNVTDAVVIDKMTSNSGSIREAVWDNLGCLIRDIIDLDTFTYRQESGFSKKTSVSVKIPKNGYIKICTDPENSPLVELVNSIDLLYSLISLANDNQDINTKIEVGSKIESKNLPEKLTKIMIEDAVYQRLLRDGAEWPKKLCENLTKEALVTADGMGTFVATILNSLSEMNLLEVFFFTDMDEAFDLGTDLAGPIGVVLKTLFVGGKLSDSICQYNDLVSSRGVGSIVIQNQGGGIRSCQQIVVECETGFTDDTALNVFTVTLDEAQLEAIKSRAPEVYEAISAGKTYTYNISLLQNGSEVQPDGQVKVYIPIPDELLLLAYEGITKIYRTEPDGSMTEMPCKIEDGCYVFTTDHFSLYTIACYEKIAEENVLQPEQDVTVTIIYPDKKPYVGLLAGAAIAVVVIVVGTICFVAKKRKKHQEALQQQNK